MVRVILYVQVDDIGDKTPLTFIHTKAAHIGKIQIIEYVFECVIDVTSFGSFPLDAGTPPINGDRELPIVAQRLFSQGRLGNKKECCQPQKDKYPEFQNEGFMCCRFCFHVHSPYLIFEMKVYAI